MYEGAGTKRYLERTYTWRHGRDMGIMEREASGDQKNGRPTSKKKKEKVKDTGRPRRCCCDGRAPATPARPALCGRGCSRGRPDLPGCTCTWSCTESGTRSPRSQRGRHHPRARGGQPWMSHRLSTRATATLPGAPPLGGPRRQMTQQMVM